MPISEHSGADADTGGPSTTASTLSLAELRRVAASLVLAAPPRNGAVFYHGDHGARVAEDFVRRGHGKYQRLDDLLKQSPDGIKLLFHLKREKDWESVKEIWWNLSRRVAELAAGDVHVYGPERDVSPNSELDASGHGGAGKFRSRFDRTKYADTVFDKVELPALDLNPLVETIYFNGRPLDQ